MQKQPGSREPSKAFAAGRVGRAPWGACTRTETPTGLSQSPRQRPEEQQLDLALRGHSDLEAASSGKQPGSGPKQLGLGSADPGSASASGHSQDAPSAPRPGPSVTPFGKDARGEPHGHGWETQVHCWPPRAGPLRGLQRIHLGQGERRQLPSLKQGCGRPHGDRRAGHCHAQPQAACPARTQTSHPLPWGTDVGSQEVRPETTRDPPLSRADTVWGGHGLRSWAQGLHAAHGAAGSGQSHPAGPNPAGLQVRDPALLGLGTDPGRDRMHGGRADPGWPWAAGGGRPSAQDCLVSRPRPSAHHDPWPGTRGSLLVALLCWAMSPGSPHGAGCGEAGPLSTVSLSESRRLLCECLWTPHLPASPSGQRAGRPLPLS